jgi:hypothetical protein
MKKLIIILLIGITSSCFPIDNRNEVMVVTSIKKISRNTDEIHFFAINGASTQNLEIYDSVNKWNIGDTLKLSK